jgi:hypothetical protein
MNTNRYRERAAVICAEVLKPHRLDLLLAYSDDPFSPAAVQFLTGFDSYAMYSLAILPSSGEVSLAFGLHHSAYLVRVKDTSAADYFLGTYAPGPFCRKVITELKVDGRPRVGMVGRLGMLSRVEKDLTVHLDAAEVIDVDDAFWRAAWNRMATDSVEEAQRIGAAVRASLRPAERAFSRPVAETWADIGRAVRRGGAHILNREMIDVKFGLGPRIPERLRAREAVNGTPTQAVAIEVSAGLGGCRATCARTWLEDGASPNALMQLQAARQQHDRLCSELRVGMTDADFVRLSATGQCAVDVQLANGDGRKLYRSGRPTAPVSPPAALLPGQVLVVRTRHPAGDLGTVHLADTLLLLPAHVETLTGDGRSLA